jgi:hypothetical protein
LSGRKKAQKIQDKDGSRASDLICLCACLSPSDSCHELFAHFCGYVFFGFSELSDRKEGAKDTR